MSAFTFIGRLVEKGANKLGQAPVWEPLKVSSQKLDSRLLWVMLGLLLFGLVMVYSASIAVVSDMVLRGELRNRFNWGDGYFFWRQLTSTGLGLFAALLFFRVPMDQWQRFAGLLFLGGLFLLVLVLVPGIGKKINGAQRWFAGILSFQPAELMKIAVLLYAADFATRKQAVMKSLMRGFLPLTLAVAIVGGLLMLQPDLGSLLVIVVIAMGILFIGGINGFWFGGMLLVLLSVFATIIWYSPWRRERIFAYLDPWSSENVLDKGYQLTHSLIAYGRGGTTGVGLGNSVEKLQYLPEAHSDFMLAVIAEEWGWLGLIAVGGVFFWLIYRAFAIGQEAKALGRDFSSFVAHGTSLWLAIQVIVHIGVTSGVLPTKGLTMPFLSFGGTSLIVCIMAMMFLLRIDYENRNRITGRTPKPAPSSAVPRGAAKASSWAPEQPSNQTTEAKVTSSKARSEVFNAAPTPRRGSGGDFSAINRR